eukprot:TRINITY_DN16_c0_g1_i1.p1 TRINITY_DN16_c0_g1~~TRINITY_DN16_c0_g1_i1.p1  ORF type:complete len:271 (-),score=55.35 TRINITY_DN16_c0_g1_i1:2980-3792(-)
MSAFLLSISGYQMLQSNKVRLFHDDREHFGMPIHQELFLRLKVFKFISFSAVFHAFNMETILFENFLRSKSEYDLKEEQGFFQFLGDHSSRKPPALRPSKVNSLCQLDELKKTHARWFRSIKPVLALCVDDGPDFSRSSLRCSSFGMLWERLQLDVMILCLCCVQQLPTLWKVSVSTHFRTVSSGIFLKAVSLLYKHFSDALLEDKIMFFQVRLAEKVLLLEQFLLMRSFPYQSQESLFEENVKSSKTTIDSRKICRSTTFQCFSFHPIA